jgi:8-oxo-dGTP pyrophosphatase MutT (NUDIX family)
MEREFSAGGAVIHYREGRWWIAVIEPQSPPGRQKRRNKPVLALPKGMVDREERPEQTAVREVREETGIDADVIAKLSDVRYVYVRSWGDRQRVFKVVSFYLLLYRAGKVDDLRPDMRIEVRRAGWIALDEAPRRLTHPGEREVARLALHYLAAHPGFDSPGQPCEASAAVQHPPSLSTEDN